MTEIMITHYYVTVKNGYGKPTTHFWFDSLQDRRNFVDALNRSGPPPFGDQDECLELSWGQTEKASEL